jgi:hypothetical protein
MTRLLLRACLFAALAGGAATAAIASAEIGAAAAASGTVEVRRASAGDWKNLDLGGPIFRGDELRTGERGRLKILFADGTVLDLGSSTELIVKEYATAAAKGGAKTVVGLTSGIARAILGDAYAGSKASYELETPTAVVRSAGTVFVVRYDAAAKSTEVLAIEGSVDVQGAIGLIGPVVKVAAGERTEVQSGKFPIPVAVADEALLTAALGDVEIIGSGRNDSLASDHPIVRGDVARADERPDAIAASGVTTAARKGVSYLEPSVPGETLRDRNAPALRANTQPIPEYKFAAPDEVPPQ